MQQKAREGWRKGSDACATSRKGETHGFSAWPTATGGGAVVLGLGRPRPSRQREKECVWHLERILMMPRERGEGMNRHS